MEDAPLTTILTPKETISETFEINQDDKNYKLNISIINKDITLNLLNEKELMKEYEKQLSLDELKRIHKIFSMLNTSKEFIEYMKAIIENKKLSIITSNENQISLEFTVEYLYKQNVIKIDLLQKKVNFELIAQDLYKKISALTEDFKKLDMNYKNIVEENKNYKEENNRMKEENKIIKDKMNNFENIINSLKKDILELKQQNESNNNIHIKKKLTDFIDSVVIESKVEYNMISSAINKRMNKKFKEIKKIYQATKDGGDPSIFHEKCDGIPNTLILIKSARNRRFGAFVSECWRKEGDRVIDKNCFIFSLDKQTIYFNNNYHLCYHSTDGPDISVNNNLYIAVTGNPLKKSALRTNENKFKNIFIKDFALSEDGTYESIYAKDYEVFQIIF